MLLDDPFSPAPSGDLKVWSMEEPRADICTGCRECATAYDEIVKGTYPKHDPSTDCLNPHPSGKPVHHCICKECFA